MRFIDMRLQVTFGAIGWANITIEHEGQSYLFDVSWLPDCHENQFFDLLLQAAIDVLNGKSETEFLLIEEPGSYMCLIDQCENELALRFYYCDMLYCNRGDEGVGLKYKLSVHWVEFIRAVSRLYLELKDHLNNPEREKKIGFRFPHEAYRNFNELIEKHGIISD